jgi:CRISPR-associated protein Csb2
MSLVLEIEHLLGVAFAAQTPASDEPDWPPQPDRVFSALVAAWGGRGEKQDERRALEWLEEQPPPEIAVSNGYPRTAPTVFVPPNDPQTRKIADRSVMPAFRRRQPRRFPAFRPEDPCIRLIWPQSVADDATLAALNELAANTPYLGHSSSLPHR